MTYKARTCYPMSTAQGVKSARKSGCNNLCGQGRECVCSKPPEKDGVWSAVRILLAVYAACALAAWAQI